MEDADKSVIPLIDRLDDYFEDPNLVSGKPNLYPFPPNFEPIPCKPFLIWPVNMLSFQVWMRKSAFLELQLARKELWAVCWADGLEAGAKNRFPKFSVIMSNKYILSI